MTRLLMTADAIGGVWQYATELAQALRPHGVEAVIAVLGPGRDAGRSSAGSERSGGGLVEGVDVIHTDLPLDWLASGPSAVAASATAIAALARDVGADLVHLNAPALAATRFPVPTVAVAHGCVATWWHATRGNRPDPAYAWHVDAMAAGLSTADALVAPSAAHAAAVQAAYALPVAPRVVHNGRTPLPLPMREVADVVFTAGRLWDDAKATPLLDRVAARIDAPFEAAGPLAGPHGETVTLRHLRHLGTLDEPALAARLAARPIYVSAARFEPFGLSVLEAAAAGCPLVLADIPTFRELWTGAALLVPCDDPEGYAEAIGRIRGDAGLRHRLGEAARRRAARYTPAAMAAGMAAIYADLLAGQERVAA